MRGSTIMSPALAIRGITLAVLCALAKPLAAAELDVASYITIVQGNIPVILSAPHGGDKLFPGIPKREDRGQQYFEVVRDQRTAELTQLLAAEIGKQLGGKPYVVIARFDRQHIDANRAPEDAYTPPGDGGPKRVYHAYHTALADAGGEIARRWGRGILLDIHGQARFPDQIIRGTRNGQTVASLIKRSGEDAITGPRSIFGALAARGYRVAPKGTPDDRIERYFAGGHIVDIHGSADGGHIDAIQVEIGSRLRTPERLEKTARDLAGAIAVFAKAYLPPVKKK